jgi:hypothetical protein
MLWGSEDTLHGRSRCTPMGREPARETP